MSLILKAPVETERIYLDGKAGSPEESRTWIDLRPLSFEQRRVAEAEARAQIAELREAQKLDDLSGPEIAGIAAMASLRALARRAICGWNGIVDPDTGAPVEVTPEAIDTLMQFEQVAVPFLAHVDARMDVWVSEGNG